MDTGRVKIYKQLGSSPNPATDTLLGTCDVNAKIPYVSWWRFNEGAWNGTAGEVVDSGGVSHGQSYGAVISNSGRFGNCALFDGVDDWIKVPIVNQLKITTTMTIEFWIYPTPPHLQGIGGLMWGVCGAYGSRILVADNGNIRSQVIFSSGQINYNSSVNATNNAWNHVVWRYDGSYQHYFLNGSKLTGQATSGTITTGTNDIQIGWGHFTHSYYHYNGRIDGVRIFNTALTDAQIATLYAENEWLRSVSLSVGRHKIYTVGVDLAGNQSSVGSVINVSRLPVPLYVSNVDDWYVGELNIFYLGEVDS